MRAGRHIADLRTLLLAAFLLMMVAAYMPATGAAQNYFVSPDGVDSRPCDLAGAPCRTITRALERARASGGEHTIHVAARQGGERAIYREAIQVRRGAVHQPAITVDGSWKGANGQRALIAPRGSGPTQAVLLELPGARLRDIDIDSGAAANAVAGLVLDTPGSGHRIVRVRVTTGPGDVAVVVNSPSSRLSEVVAAATGSPALDYSALGEPVLVEDSTMRQLDSGPAIRGSGLSSLIFRRSMAFAPAASQRVVATEGGRLFLDSALISGGSGGAIHLGGATGPSLRAVSSTIDSGQAGIADQGLAAVTLATGGNAEVDIIGSILLEPPLITVAGGAEIRCSYSDVPHTVVRLPSPPQTISCGTGFEGNTHSSPSQLFAGTAPFTDPGDYRLKAGSPAINTGPNPAPPDATAFDLRGEARIQPPGTCAESANVIDKGAIEFGCLATASAPRPPGLFDNRNRALAPVIRRHRALSRKIAKGRKARIAFRLNTPARVSVAVLGSKVRRTLRRGRRGANVVVVPTRRLKVRKRAYRVKLVARSEGGVSKPRIVRFRLVPTPRR